MVGRVRRRGNSERCLKCVGAWGVIKNLSRSRGWVKAKIVGRGRE